MKKNENKNNNIDININFFSIFKCFYYNQKTELLSGENKCYCNKCKKLTDSNTTTKICINPNNLIINLNRGKKNIYDVKLDLIEIIDITQFVLEKEKLQIKYNLYGVITHIGQTESNDLLHHVKIQLIINGIDLIILLLIL